MNISCKKLLKDKVIVTCMSNTYIVFYLKEEQTELSHVQSNITILNERIQELAISKVGQPQFWCTGCHMEGHHIL